MHRYTRRAIIIDAWDQSILSECSLIVIAEQSLLGLHIDEASLKSYGVVKTRLIWISSFQQAFICSCMRPHRYCWGSRSCHAPGGSQWNLGMGVTHAGESLTPPTTAPNPWVTHGNDLRHLSHESIMGMIYATSKYPITVLMICVLLLWE